MKIMCQIPGCGHLSENRDIGLCATHARQQRKSAAPKENPKRQRIAKQSDEGKERSEIYHSIKAIWIVMPENVMCRVCQSRLTSEPHHMAGKLADLLYDVRKWLPVCRRCHERIELNPEEAYANGWSLSRHAIETA